MLKLDRHVPSPGVPEFQRRFAWLIGFVALAFLVLVGRLWQLQVVRGERYFQSSTYNFNAHLNIPAMRGKIKDRAGNILVDNRPSFNVYVTPRFFTKLGRENLVKLLGLTDAEVADLDAKVKKAIATKDPAQPAVVLEDVDRDRFAIISQNAADLPGVTVKDVPHRSYPFGPLAAHVLGYMNMIQPADKLAHTGEGYEDGDYIGRAGIERSLETYLRGKEGVEHFVQDAKGNRKDDREAEQLIVGPKFVPPVPGHNVVLTLDVELQRLAERSLRGHPVGAVVAVEVKTGRILAMVSKPAYDLNEMSGHLSHEEDAQMKADPQQPYVNKTIEQHYPPGSTYKFVTALAALEDKQVKPEDRVFCTGELDVGKRAFHCDGYHGSVSLYEAITQSCDVYFWTLAEKLPLDKIAAMAEMFGFGQPTGLDLETDLPGRVPTKAYYDQLGGFHIGYALNTAIGQGATEVTVLQLALAYAAIANGGDLYVPQIVQRVETASGELVKDYPPVIRRHIDLQPGELAEVKRGLWGVVNDPKGTAYAARLDGISVAGKTGTAQVRKLTKQGDSDAYDPFRDHAWFAGYAPADDPEIAVVVLVEHGGHGGHVAAPPAMEIIRGYFDLKNGQSIDQIKPVDLPDDKGGGHEPSVEDEPAVPDEESTQ